MRKPNSALVQLLLSATLVAAGGAIYLGPAQAGQDEHPSSAEMLVDPDITSDLSGVPEFAPVTLEKPYTRPWQNQLLAYHARFVGALEADSQQVGQIETGSISDLLQ
jgi:hypothetical protein